MSKSRSKAKGIVFQVPFEGQPDKELAMTAYAFDRNGRFLTSAAFNAAAGRFVLDLEPRQARQTRLFIAPTPPKTRQTEAITVDLMERWQAYEPVWQYDPQRELFDLFPIPEIHWWPWCFCRVRGRVVRPVEIKGETYDMPVCHARVHICEVDRIPRLILKLPDKDILRLRDDLLPLLEKPPIRWPRPLPDPPPFRYDPGVIDPSPQNIAAMNRLEAVSFESRLAQVALNPQPLPPMPSPLSSMSRMAMMAEADVKTSISTEMPLAATISLTAHSANIVRQALLDSVHLIYPYLCWLDWFWYYLRCDEVAVLETDMYGRFDTTVWYRCLGDHPDLYFWVEYSIGGEWTTVYKPPKGCYTYWDYECGREVTIRVTDPRVGWCSPVPRVPGNQIAILSIGEEVGFEEINGPTTGVLAGLTTDGAPFGAILEPRVHFGEDLIANGVTHYRWSYRKIADSSNNAVSDTWHALDRQVIRHYSYTAPDGKLKFKPYVLGPDTDADLTVTGLNLFEIQPDDPPTGEWAPEVNAHENTASAFFETHLLNGGDAKAGAGKYELKLELFDKNGTRIIFKDGAVTNVRPMVAVGDAPFGPDLDTDDAPVANLLMSAGKVVGFRMVIHVDNNPCEAEIHPVQIGSRVANPCGFLNFNNTGELVTIAFKARHENDFATFNFDINRGSVGFVEGADGKVGTAVAGYSEANGEYSKGVAVSYLLRPLTPDGEPCVRAAFAETLYVKAMATNGWTRLDYLDRYAMPLAFALAPVSDLGG
ncbi:MAG: hypothetical protein H6667_13055 [Ardenticatenaceae bacterium]|nr:hypothetical protein [Ardenticatenaceae bacterium]MCB9442672.1 hypothetical protein [Ardenticatenaceae bacterium]